MTFRVAAPNRTIAKAKARQRAEAAGFTVRSIGRTVNIPQEIWSAVAEWDVTINVK